MNHAMAVYKRDFRKTIKNLRTSDPKLIGDKKATSAITQISVESFKKHFEQLNTAFDGDTEVGDVLPTNFDGNLLNGAFTEDEIWKSVKRCKTGKAAGCDGITNECIKAAAPVLVPLFTKLFNSV